MRASLLALAKSTLQNFKEKGVIAVASASP